MQKPCQPIADGWHATPPVGKRWGTSCPTVAMLRKSLPFETVSGCHVSATSLPVHFRLAGPARPMHQDDTQPLGRYRRYALVSVEARERGGKRAQCSTTVQDAQERQVSRVTISGSRVFLKGVKNMQGLLMQRGMNL